MTSVKLTEMMTAQAGDVISTLGTAAGAHSTSSDRQNFATVMNDTAQSYKSSEKSGIDGNRTEGNTDVQESYQASTQGNAMDRKVSKTAETDTDKFRKLQDDQGELTEDFAQGMKELLTEKLDASEEDLEAAMAVLGLDYLDLMNPSNLTQLAAQLTGTEDVCTLLMNEDFTQLLQQSELLISDLTQKTGISREELLNWLEAQNKEMVMGGEDFSAMVKTENQQNVDEVPEDAQVSAESSEEASEMVVTQRNSGEAIHTVQNKEQSVMEGNEGITPGQMSPDKVEKSEYSAQEDVDSAQITEGSIESEQVMSQETEEFPSGQSENQMFDKDGSEGKEGQFDQMTYRQSAGFENVRAEAVTETPAQPQSNAANVDVENLMRQFGEFARLHVSQDTTSLDLQLNPENLGKLYLHISAGKEGNVTAEIATTSQEVKEALETQIAELRVTLVQQGVKVDAVEVTVASHEFEQNLEQNAAHDQRQGEEQEQQNQGRVRSLLRGELDDLSGLASEEEILAARIMKDNGNSMDVTV